MMFIDIGVAITLSSVVKEVAFRLSRGFSESGIPMVYDINKAEHHIPHISIYQGRFLGTRVQGSVVDELSGILGKYREGFGTIISVLPRLDVNKYGDVALPLERSRGLMLLHDEVASYMQSKTDLYLPHSEGVLDHHDRLIRMGPEAQRIRRYGASDAGFVNFVPHIKLGRLANSFDFPRVEKLFPGLAHYDFLLGRVLLGNIDAYGRIKKGELHTII